MNLNIKDIQGIVSIYTDILCQIIKMDVGIVDAELTRIAMSRKSKVKEIDTNVADEGHILKKAIDSGQTQVVTSPREDAICAECACIDNCTETFHMCTPIMVKGKAIGAIAFACFDQKSRRRALRNQTAYEQFLQQFAELIAAKAVETAETLKSESMLSLLEAIIDRIDIGVIVFGLHDEVVRINDIARKLLRIKQQDYMSHAELVDTGISVVDRKQYTLNMNGKAYHLIGKTFDLKIDDYSQVFIFQEAERISGTVESGGKSAAGINRLVGKSQMIQDIRKKVLLFSNSPATVLISGGSGTEKKALALALHEESERAPFPFLSVHCTVIPEVQLEQELFGTAPPAKSGTKGRVGIIEAAAKGTFVLEEVGDLSLRLQAELLAILDTLTVKRVGGTKRYKISARLIATSSRDLAEMVKEGTFLGELYYKLKVLPIYMPPLRERNDDIPLLAQSFLHKYARRIGKLVRSIEPAFWEQMVRYAWPGNVWELENVIQYVINIMPIDGVINSSLLPDDLTERELLSEDEGEWRLDHIERNVIKRALEKYGDSLEAKNEIAEKLDISIATLYRKLKKYQL